MPEDPNNTLQLDVHEIRLLQPRTKPLSLSVDILGLGAGNLTTPTITPHNTSQETLRLNWRAQVTVEPHEPIWQPLVDALASADEQDSDLYFVLHEHHVDAAGTSPAETELGSAHINLERLLARGSNADEEVLTVLDAAQNRIAHLVVSVSAILALRWVERGGREAAVLGASALELSVAPGAFPTEVLGVDANRPLTVSISLPCGLGERTSDAVHLAGSAARFNFAHEARVEASSAPYHALLATLFDADSPLAIGFTVHAASTPVDERRLELGSGTVDLRALLASRLANPERLVIQLKRRPTDGAVALAVGTLAVSLDAVDTLRRVRASGSASTDTQRPTADRAMAHWIRSGGQPPPSIPTLAKLGVKTSRAGTRRSVPAASTGAASIDWAVIDALEAVSPSSGEASADFAEQTLETARAMSEMQASIADFGADRWPAARVQKLFGAATRIARLLRTLEAASEARAQAAHFELSQTRAAYKQYAQRQRVRVSELRAAAAPTAGRGDGESASLRAALAMYEPLLHGIQGAAESALDAATVMRTECDRAGILLPRAVVAQMDAARKTAATHAHAISLCTLSRGGGAAIGHEALAQLHSATSAAHGLAHPLAVRSVATDSAASEAADAGVRSDRATLSVTASRLRLRGSALGLRGEAVELTMTLLPRALRLPLLRTPRVQMSQNELDLNFEHALHFNRGGATWSALTAALSEATAGEEVMPRRSAQGALHVQMYATKENRSGVHEVASATVALGALLRSHGATAPIQLYSAAGNHVAEVFAGLEGAELLDAARRLAAAAPRLSLSPHAMRLHTTGAIARALRGALGVWLETDLCGIADAPLRTSSLPPSDVLNFGVTWHVPLPPDGRAERQFLSLLRDAQSEPLRAKIALMCTTATGTSALASAHFTLAEGGLAAAAPTTLQRVSLFAPSTDGSRSPGEELGKLDLALDTAGALEAVRAARSASPTVTVALQGIELAPPIANDVSISVVWVEATLPTSMRDRPLISERLGRSRAVLKPTLRETIHLSPDQLRSLGDELSAPFDADETRCEYGGGVKELSAAAAATATTPAPPPAARQADEQADPQVGSIAGDKPTQRTGVLTRLRPQKPRTRAPRSAGASPQAGRDSASTAALPINPTTPTESDHLPVGSEYLPSYGVVAAGDVKEVETACDIEFVLKGAGPLGDTRVLGVSIIDLREMLRSGEEKRLVELTLLGPGSQTVGQLHASLHAQHALRAAWWCHARALHAHLSVEELTLSPGVARRVVPAGAMSVWVSTSACGMAQQVLKTSELSVGGGLVRFGAAFEISLAHGSDGAMGLERALCAGSAPMHLEVWARGVAAADSGGLIGVASLSLRDVLRNGGDALHHALPIIDKHGKRAGDLTVSLMLGDAAAALFGPRSWEREATTLWAHTLTLETVAATVYDSYRVSVDFCGIDLPNPSSGEPLSAPKPLDGSALIRFEDSPWEVALDPGSKAYQAVVAALATVEEQDSDVYFVLYGSKGDSPPVELGSAFLNLEQLLKRKRDASRERVAVLDNTRKRVGWLVVSVRAVEAIRWVSRGVESSPSLGATVHRLEISKELLSQIGSSLFGRELRVDVELPGGVPLLKMAPARHTKGVADFNDHSADAPVRPGSREFKALLREAEAPDGDSLSATFIVRAVAGANVKTQPEREIGRGSVPLRHMMEEGASELQRAALQLTATESNLKSATLGSLSFSLRAAELMRRLAQVVRARDASAARPPIPAVPLFDFVARAATEAQPSVDMSGPRFGGAHIPAPRERLSTGAGTGAPMAGRAFSSGVTSCFGNVLEDA